MMMRLVWVVIPLVLFSIIGIQESFAEEFEFIASPRHQLESGIASENIQCREDRVLVLRINDNPACVFEKTADKMNWKIINTNVNTEIMAEVIELNLAPHVEFVDDSHAEKEVHQVDLASLEEYEKMFNKDFRFFSGIGWVDMSGHTSQSIVYYEDPENLGQLILDIDTMFDVNPTIFPENSLMSVQTDKTQYNHKEIIQIQGQVADVVTGTYPETLVSIFVTNNNNTKFNEYASAEVNPDGRYQTTIDASGSKWFYEGIYTITVNPGHSKITASTEIEIISGFTPPQRPFDTKDIILDLSSPTEFVDDGREYPLAMGHRGPPQLMYDIIIDSYKDFDVDEKGVTTFTAISHEKYSINPGVGFYAEDWFPEYIPDGQKLLFTETSCYESGSCGLGITFVPTTFVLTPFTTNHNLNLAKGFSVGVQHSTLPVDDLGDYAEHFRESFIESEGGYGEIREMTRDGKVVLAFAGGNSVNPYQASVSFYLDEFTSVNVHSNYHTLDELIPIFESIMNE